MPTKPTYEFSVNITRKELVRLLAYAEEHDHDTIGVHITPSSGIGHGIHASNIGGGWKDYDNHVEVTDHESW